MRRSCGLLIAILLLGLLLLAFLGVFTPNTGLVTTDSREGQSIEQQQVPPENWWVVEKVWDDYYGPGQDRIKLYQEFNPERRAFGKCRESEKAGPSVGMKFFLQAEIFLPEDNYYQSFDVAE